MRTPNNLLSLWLRSSLLAGASLSVFWRPLRTFGKKLSAELIFKHRFAKMVRNYQRKTERAEVPQELYNTAMQEVDSGKTIRQAAKDHGLCHVSLHRRLKKREQGEAPCMGYSKHAQVFSQHQEQELARYVTWSAELRYGLTPVEVRQLAYQCGEKFAIRMPPSWSENRQAGEDWFSGFRERYQFSLRKAENTSLGRAIGFNKPAVDLFFDNLENVLSRQNFGPHQIYNVDETGMSTVPKSSRVVAKTGTRSVGRVVSAERGTLVTLVCAINAIGNSVPPMFIFPRKTYRDHFIRGGPPGSIGRANGSAIDLCREHNITLLSLPPHCSHKLQPLDRVVYGPLKTYVTSRCHAWTRENPGKSLSIYDIPGIAGSELPRATTQHNLIESFRCTGIWPMNRHVFTDRDFAASLVTERPLIPSGSSSDPSGPPAAPGPSSPPPSAPGPSGPHAAPGPSGPPPSAPGPSGPPPAAPGPSSPPAAKGPSGPPAAPVPNGLSTVPGPSGLPSAPGPSGLPAGPSASTPATPSRCPTSQGAFSPELVMPFPQAVRAANNGNGNYRRRRKSAILTDSPVKRQLELNKAKKPRTSRTARSTNTGQPKSHKRVGKAQPRKRQASPVSSSDSDDEEENICLVCTEHFHDSRSGEKWVQCSGCNFWAHEDCTDIGSRTLLYICQNCLSD
ncbi:hypothetical protein RRG08_017235 [Elysia crispata]|uniref:Zinc finger PHD-type domain-containing protein n=1 Tax=Elysia crispata TaxID=231223 RepID=A0AAE0Z496_9GAST|nr:hypothetical protein RRG08_017235 [Elysia crispata]